MTYRAIIISVLIATVVSAQSTTQPADPLADWNETVGHFAEAIVNADTRAAERSLTPAATAITFNAARDAAKPTVLPPTQDTQLSKLCAQISSAELLGAHVYRLPNESLGSDIAGDFKASSKVPDEFKDQMAPKEPARTRRTADTASRWLRDSLHATDDQYVAVLVYFAHDNLPGLNGGLALRDRALFVFLKGDIDANGAMRITDIVYGDPLAVPATGLADTH